jgi:D-alanyl-D-alanine carboxypeptidase
MIQLDSKIGVIVLTNTNDSNPIDISRQLMSTVGQAVTELTTLSPDVVPWDP